MKYQELIELPDAEIEPAIRALSKEQISSLKNEVECGNVSIKQLILEVKETARFRLEIDFQSSLQAGRKALA